MSDPMSDERLAEIHERAGLAVEQLTGDGSSTEFCVQAMPHLLAEVERLRAELTQVTTATTYLQGPEECLERECEEYFDDDGNERPGVEYCSHLKAKRLTVDEHLAAEAEQARLAEQVKRVRAVTAEARARDETLLARRDAEPYDRRERRREWESRAHEVRDLADRIDAALGGTEAGQ